MLVVMTTKESVTHVATSTGVTVRPMRSAYAAALTQSGSSPATPMSASARLTGLVSTVRTMSDHATTTATCLKAVVDQQQLTALHVVDMLLAH